MTQAGKATATIVLATLIGLACQGPPRAAPAPVPSNGVYTIALTSSSVSTLPKCTPALAGTTAYVQSPIGLWSCIANTWVPIPCTTITAGAVAYSSASQTLLACVSGQWTVVSLPQGTPGPQGDAGAVSIVVQLPAPSSQCPTGGTEIESGVDSNGDGQLEMLEINSISFVCNGATGDSGATGATGPAGTPGSQIQVSSADASHCPAGGEQIDIGFPGDGGLAIQQTVYVCNGAAGGSDGGVPPTGGCSRDADCSTSSVCEAAICDPATHTCTTTPITCDDGNVCTDDACDPVSGCTHVANQAACDDGDFCTTGDRCSAGACVGVPSECPTQMPPTVTDVAVVSTNPDNGTIAYNTGVTTILITGTAFSTVTCPAGVTLDDLDGRNVPVGTRATSCTVDSDTQITATFPAGIRTNGITGWNVLVSNFFGGNTTSDVRFKPAAGLLVSEVYIGSPGALGAADREFVELYNPTSRSIDVTSGGIGMRLHMFTSSGIETTKTLTFLTAGVAPSHGFLLLISIQSVDTDPWFAGSDAIFAAGLVANAGVYVSLSSASEDKVIDKAGWGAASFPAFEGSPIPPMLAGVSASRKPAGGAGHASDTDDNASDFNPPSTAISPQGSSAPPQP